MKTERPPTTWVLLANEIKQELNRDTDGEFQDEGDVVRFLTNVVTTAEQLADLIIEASERPADKLKKQR